VEDSPLGTTVNDAHWSFFLPTGPEVSLLELGSGTGERCCRLARGCGRVETLSFSEEQVRAVTDRARSSGLDNVHASRYRPGLPLEFDDGTFDALVVDRILGYPSFYSGDGGTARAVERLVAETFRVLATGGVLYVGVENRLHHLLGLAAVFGALRKSAVRRDSGLEANLRALGNRGRARRLTLDAALRILRSTGFSDVRAFAPLPDALRPQAVVSLGGRESQRFLFRQRVRRHSFQTRAAAMLGRVAVATGFLRRVVPYYYLVASK